MQQQNELRYAVNLMNYLCFLTVYGMLEKVKQSENIYLFMMLFHDERGCGVKKTDWHRSFCSFFDRIVDRV